MLSIESADTAIRRRTTGGKQSDSQFGPLISIPPVTGDLLHHAKGSLALDPANEKISLLTL